ncbi:hypothetical protein BDM02DRAFT_3184576 [Thelephora ganbajun]|uniref:Uncharacterized protein n=1 Tax=Thelephora ganbajun TaxID=370292 RepID=A0ACB6ZPF8_THEGA|nr:hypothetical protein BDM02DRAFT_3184576 [Thelephora ganbajun]
MSGTHSQWYYPHFPSTLYTDSIWAMVMASFKSNVQRGAVAPMGADLTLTDLLTLGLINWDGPNADEECPCDSMCFAAAVGERLLTCLEVLEAQVHTQENALQLQVLGNAALEQEAEVLKQKVAQLEGEFSVLLAWVEVLEWTSPLEYLSVEDLLRLDAEGEVSEMSSSEALELGLCQDFGALVDRPDPKDAYGLDYPPLTELVNAVLAQEDLSHPCHQFANSCCFDDVLWQQAILSLKNQDEHCQRLVDQQVIDHPHKWSTRVIWYSAVTADCLYCLLEHEHTRGDCLEAEIVNLSCQVHMLSSCLLAMDTRQGAAVIKINK